VIARRQDIAKEMEATQGDMQRMQALLDELDVLNSKARGCGSSWGRLLCSR
jgi:hypothetical protein